MKVSTAMTSNYVDSNIVANSFSDLELKNRSRAPYLKVLNAIQVLNTQVFPGDDLQRMRAELAIRRYNSSTPVEVPVVTLKINHGHYILGASETKRRQ